MSALPLHQDFAKHWEEVVQLGLSLEEQNSLVDKLPPSSNCLSLVLLILNEVVNMSRLLTDVFHKESLVRRNLILTLLSPSVKENLSKSQIREFLLALN